MINLFLLNLLVLIVQLTLYKLSEPILYPRVLSFLSFFKIHIITCSYLTQVLFHSNNFSQRCGPCFGLCLATQSDQEVKIPRYPFTSYHRFILNRCMRDHFAVIDHENIFLVC